MIQCRSHVWKYTRVRSQCVGSLHHASKSHRLHSHAIPIGLSRSTSFRQHNGKRGGKRGAVASLLLNSATRKTRDIYVDDLDATLEAHRATNTAKIIRRVSAPTDPAVKHISLGNANDHEVHAEAHAAGGSLQAVRDERVKVDLVAEIPPKEDRKGQDPWDYWPVGTIQHKRLAKAPQKKVKGSVQEYHARAMIPVNVWRRPSDGVEDKHALRPWLDDGDVTREDASQR